MVNYKRMFRIKRDNIHLREGCVFSQCGLWVNLGLRCEVGLIEYLLI